MTILNKDNSEKDLSQKEHIKNMKHLTKEKYEQNKKEKDHFEEGKTGKYNFENEEFEKGYI